MAANTNRLLRKVDDTEKFYKSKDFKDRPPSIMIEEFNQMQKESFELQRDFYMNIKDMQMLDLSPITIKQVLRKAGMNNKLIGNLMRGQFTPVNFSEPQFKSKIEDVEGVAKILTEKSDQYVYNVDRNYVFPKFELNNVKREWSMKQFFPETYNPDTNKMEGGYKPELEGAVTNDKGDVIYDENGKIKREPTLLQRGFEKIKPLISPLTNQRSQTTLPETPGVDPNVVASAPPINSQTGLTDTQEQLYSPTEKLMAKRMNKNKGIA